MDAITDAYGRDVRMIDRTSVWVHYSTATFKKSHSDSCLGSSRGGVNVRIHALIDNYGLPVKLVITLGQTNDLQAAAELLKYIHKGQMLLADRAYDADWLREMVFKKGGWANIPPKTNRKAPICFLP